MTLEEIKELIALANEHGLAEIEFERDGTRVRIKRATAEHEIVLPPVAQPAPPPVAKMPAPPPPAPPQRGGRASATAPQPILPAAPVAESIVYVKAPIVGTYYESPSPGEPPFVEIGHRVEKGQVLCIIESMKLMNEIESEISGVVMQKIAVNANPVEYGEALLAVRTE